MLSEDTNIKEGVSNVFYNLLIEAREQKPSIDGITFESLGRDDLRNLKIPFSEEEVFVSLSSLYGDKAIELNDFTMVFWQHYQDFVNYQVIRLSREFLEQRSFKESLNVTFLVLVHKKRGAQDLKDFKPNGLVGRQYKLLAKALANKLKKDYGKSGLYLSACICGGHKNFRYSLFIENDIIDSRLKRTLVGKFISQILRRRVIMSIGVMVQSRGRGH